MTQVPWFGLTPRSPAIAGSDTLAIDVSSTFMNVASDSAIVPSTQRRASSGCSAAAVRRRMQCARRRGIGGGSLRRRLRGGRRLARLRRRRACGRRLAAMIALRPRRRPRWSSALEHRGLRPPARRAARRPASCRPGRARRPSPSIDRPTRSGCAASSFGVQRDAHRHALHHLDPVAGGVLRRQQRESRTGARAQAGHACRGTRPSCRRRRRSA